MPISPEIMEPALSEAWLCLQDSANGVVEAHEALRACRAICEMGRMPQYEEYDPHALLSALSNDKAGQRCTFTLARVSACIGDSAQVQEHLRSFMEGAVLESDATLSAALLEVEQVPLIRFEFDGPGRFSQQLALKGRAVVSMEDLETRWTAATKGGRIDRTPHGADLRLKGVRVVPETPADFTPFVDSVREAERRLRLVSGGASNDSKGDLDAARRAIQRALSSLDGDGRSMVPSNVAAVWNDVFDEMRPLLQEKALALDAQVVRVPPPIFTHRQRLQSALSNLLRHAAVALPNGGTVSCVLDYSPKARSVELLFSMEGSRYVPGPGHFIASARRSLVEIHHGGFDESHDATSATVSVTLPDPVGRRLDEWIPGWDAFSDRSQQMLRLLKSGGPIPPEDFLLGGILEEELERCLLVRLSVAPATTLAHDLELQAPSPKGSSAERLAKVLGQIRKGKPKKEICKPAYAAEIFWAFRVDARHRAAVGIGALDEGAVTELCALLWATPPDVPAILKILTLVQGDPDLIARV